MPQIAGQICDRGALVDLIIRQGNQAPLHMPALLDTGMPTTMIDIGWLTANGYQPANGMSVYTTDNSEFLSHKYNVEFALIPQNDEPAFQPLTILEGKIMRLETKFAAIVGRDILARCKLIYDGRNRTFTLTW